jgi:hypothetical protein
MAGLPDDDVFTITVGPTSFAVRDGRTTSTINQPDTASGTVSAEDIAHSPTDWANPAQAAIGSHAQMAGQVIEARPTGDGSVVLSLRSALELDEGLMPAMVVQNLTAQEIVYAAVRSAGFATANIDIHGLDDIAVEPMWVLAPVDGVRVERPVRVGVVEFIDGEAGREMLRRFSPSLDPVFSDPLAEAPAFARVAVVASLSYEAEQEGLALIDTAAAWMTTRLRYSWSHGVNGSLQHYERKPTRVVVERRDGAGVLAVDGARRWSRRSRAAGRSPDEVNLAPAAQWTDPPFPPSVAPADRQALLALQRVATASDPVQRVGALWEAIEFYVAKRNPDRQFARDQVDAIVDRATGGLGGGQADRVEKVLRQFLNQPSITTRLEYVVRTEGVPITSDDLALLARLRKERNSALHGEAAAPDHEDIDRALAVMSRAIVTRIARTS